MIKKTIIFDFDGTLADTMPYIYKVANQMAAQYGFSELSPAEFEALRDKSPFEIIDQLKIPLLKIPFALHKGKQLLNAHMKEVGYIKEMDSVIKKLKVLGFQLGILTSNSRENIDVFLNKYELKVFDFIYTENNLFGKQLSLRKILKREKLDINTTIYIGDEVRDIEACQVLGLDIISVTWGFSSKSALKKYKPTFIAEKPQDLLTILSPHS